MTNAKVKDSEYEIPLFVKWLAMGTGITICLSVVFAIIASLISSWLGAFFAVSSATIGFGAIALAVATVVNLVEDYKKQTGRSRW